MNITDDKFEITALAGRFETAFDRGDVSAHLATWVAEPELESSMGVYSGAPAYREWLEGFMAQTRAAGGTRHLITNADVTVDGDSATASFYLTVINQTTGKIMGTATFDDELIRHQNGWLFKKRRLAVDANLNVEG
jgi:SnoaL-like domain